MNLFLVLESILNEYTVEFCYIPASLIWSGKWNFYMSGTNA